MLVNTRYIINFPELITHYVLFLAPLPQLRKLEGSRDYA